MYKQFEEQFRQHWFQFILDNPDKPWDYSTLSENSNVSWNIICKYPKKKWSLPHFCCNSNMTYDIYTNNDHLNWSSRCFLYLAKCSDVTLDTVLTMSQIPLVF
jgi:hypothetical protein